MRARSFCCPAEKRSPSRSSSNQACTAFRTSPILTPRKEAAPLRYFVHHWRVAAVARAFRRNCNLSMRPSSAGAEALERFIGRSLQLFRATLTGCCQRARDGRERDGQSWSSVGQQMFQSLPLLVGQPFSAHPSRLPALQTRPSRGNPANVAPSGATPAFFQIWYRKTPLGRSGPFQDRCSALDQQANRGGIIVAKVGKVVESPSTRLVFRQKATDTGSPTTSRSRSRRARRQGPSRRRRSVPRALSSARPPASPRPPARNGKRLPRPRRGRLSPRPPGALPGRSRAN